MSIGKIIIAISVALCAYVLPPRALSATGYDLLDDPEIKAVQDSEGAYRLGRFYLAESSRQNEATAFKWMLRAAEMGHVASQFTIGVFYFSGRGTATNVTE